ncbi:unnamed protein product [Durusdinium trenchii]|uniref:Uncharacterized protein n=2 Tax=Durusdinium trenchii TaxID=1381693 RepID=A0ABP0I4E4_9DINO
MPILLAMLMLRGPNLQLVRSAALEVLSSLPDSSPRKLSAFLAAGGLFVLLSMLSPSTKQGHEAEVERAAQLFEELLAQHGGVLAPLLEECNPSSLLQKLAKDSRSSAKTKQHALAGRRVLERGETLGRPPRGDVRAERRLQSAGAAVAGGYSPPSGRSSRASSPNPLLPGGVTLRLLLDQREHSSESLAQALGEFQGKVLKASDVVLCELSADSGLAELAAAAARGGFTPALPRLSTILGKFAGHPKARAICGSLLLKYLKFSEIPEVLPFSWAQLPSAMRSALLEILEEGIHADTAKALRSEDARAVLALLQDQSTPDLQAFALRVLRNLFDPGRKGDADVVRFVPQALSGALTAAMPAHPVLGLEVLGTLALKEDFRAYFANQQPLTKFLAHCCLQPDTCKGSDVAAVQRAASRCLAHLGVSSAQRHQVVALRGLFGSTADLTVKAYLGIALGIEHETQRTQLFPGRLAEL